MAKRRQPAKQTGGSRLFALLLGLIIGVAAAAAVAWFVTQVPMPFLDKASRDPAQTLLPDPRDAPDPNMGMYGKADSNNGAAKGLPPLQPLAPDTGTAGPDMSDDIARLLSSLDKASKAPATAPVPGTGPGTNGQQASADAATRTIYYLQAGAFRSEPDADSVKARILLLGLPARIEKGESGGATIYRVRVGPFKGIDEMNRSRARLAENSIESAVVRQ